MANVGGFEFARFLVNAMWGIGKAIVILTILAMIGYGILLGVLWLIT